MSLFNVFRTFEETLPFSADAKTLRTILESETAFEDNPPKNWKYRYLGKNFNGYLRGHEFLLIQKPLSGTRFGSIIKGSLKELTSGGHSIDLKSWVDPRAKRKLIFGYFLSTLIIARMLRDRFFMNEPVTQDSILPYLITAALPMTIYASYLYDKGRNEGVQRIKALFRSQS